MSRMKTDLAHALGIPAEAVKYTGSQVPALLPDGAPEVAAARLAEADFQEARKNIADAIGKGRKMLDAMTELAVDADTARVYEVATELMRVYVDVNEKLIDIHAKRALTDPLPAHGQGPASVTNNLNIVATTDEIVRKILMARRDEAEEK